MAQPPSRSVAAAAAPFPVLVFSHAYWLESATSHSYLMEELASHGYVVASLSHPYESLTTVFPDGRLVGLDLANPTIDAEQRFAQIAALADAQFVVGKTVQGDRTHVSVRKLRDDERVGEIARMIGGVTVGQAAKKAAKELLAVRA